MQERGGFLKVLIALALMGVLGFIFVTHMPTERPGSTQSTGTVQTTGSKPPTAIPGAVQPVHTTVKPPAAKPSVLNSASISTIGHKLSQSVGNGFITIGGIIRLLLLTLVIVAGGQVLRNKLINIKNKKLATEMNYFKIIPPQKFEMKNTDSARLLIASFAQNLMSVTATKMSGQSWVRFVLHKSAVDGQIHLYIGVHRNKERQFISSFSGYYPGVELQKKSEEELPMAGIPNNSYVSELEMVRKTGWEAQLPIKIFQDIKAGGDPLDSIMASMGAGRLESQTEVLIDIILTPVHEGKYLYSPANKAAKAYTEKAQGGSSTGDVSLNGIIDEIRYSGKSSKSKPRSYTQANENDRNVVSLIRKRATPPEKAFKTGIRIAAWGGSAFENEHFLKSTVHGFSVLEQANGFRVKSTINRKYIIDRIRKGYMGANEGHVFSSLELYPLVRIPDSLRSTLFNDFVEHARFRTIPIPPELITDIPGNIMIGKSNYPGTYNAPVKLPLGHLMKHAFIMGKTGSGKGVTMRTMLLSMIDNMVKYPDVAPGFTYIDPHGDDIRDVMSYIPDELYDKVHIFHAKNTQFPRGFNLIEPPMPGYEEHTVSTFVQLIRDRFPTGVGPRMEHFMKNGLLSLLTMEGTTILHLQQLFGDERFRAKVVRGIKDPVLQAFWKNEFSAVKDIATVIGPIWNKLGAFASYPAIRHVVGQAHGTINPRMIMDNGEIHLVDLSGGMEDSLSLIGASMVSKYHYSALSRSDTPKEFRRPHILVCDEIHVYATNLMSSILSEDRKFGLGLVLATQYLDRIPKDVLGGILGNVGTTILLNLGENDSMAMAKTVAPQFDNSDLLNLSERNAVIKTEVGEQEDKRQVKFSFRNDYPPMGDPERADKLLAFSDVRDGRPLEEVEKEINRLFHGIESHEITNNATWGAPNENPAQANVQAGESPAKTASNIPAPGEGDEAATSFGGLKGKLSKAK